LPPRGLRLSDFDLAGQGRIDGFRGLAVILVERVLIDLQGDGRGGGAKDLPPIFGSLDLIIKESRIAKQLDTKIVNIMEWHFNSMKIIL
jgi:hypothetical protein